jgi:hypothetical protein
MTANTVMTVIAKIIFTTILKLRTKDILDAVCFEQFLGKKMRENESNGKK